MFCCFPHPQVFLLLLRVLLGKFVAKEILDEDDAHQFVGKCTEVFLVIIHFINIHELITPFHGSILPRVTFSQVKAYFTFPNTSSPEMGKWGHTTTSPSEMVTRQSSLICSTSGSSRRYFFFNNVVFAYYYI